MAAPVPAVAPLMPMLMLLAFVPPVPALLEPAPLPPLPEALLSPLSLSLSFEPLLPLELLRFPPAPGPFERFAELPPPAALLAPPSAADASFDELVAPALSSSAGATCRSIGVHAASPITTQTKLSVLRLRRIDIRAQIDRISVKRKLQFSFASASTVVAANA